MKKIFQTILRLLAQAYLVRFKPVIIAVTGNTGKTSTKEAIMAVLKPYRRVRMSTGNLNNEWGVPLSILGDGGEEYYEQGGTVGFWIKVLGRGIWGLFLPLFKYPEILVLEYGADRPGDIAKLARSFKPHLAVVTAVGEIPVHVEYFSNPQHLAREKRKLVEILNGHDFAVLNGDDPVVLEMKEKTKAAVWTFGFSEGVSVKVSNFDFKIEPDGEPRGVVFKLHHRESFVPCRIEGVLGKSQAWSASAAAAVGLIFGLNLVQISASLAQYHGSAGRLKILKGTRNSFIIDDTYNASPASMHLALETLKSLPAKRKIAVLGDMLELGEYSERAHREAGNFAATSVDWLMTVGPKAKFIADAAGNQMPKENIISLENSFEAGQKVREMLQGSDLILVKGSQGMRMEKVVEEIMVEPANKKTLLVRQSKKWLNKS